MKKQFRINVTGKDDIDIDLNENELVSIYITNNPYAVKQNNPITEMTINGNRWHDEEMDILEWEGVELTVGDKISIEVTESDIQPTPISKDYLYIEPEEECSFCNKKKSEVEHLIASKIYACICNDCVIACMDLINEQNAT